LRGFPGSRNTESKTEKGTKAEDLAARHLKKQGFKIICRNWRAKTAEVDIIAEDGPTLVFIEVKARSTRQFGLPEEAVTPHKQQKMARAAMDFVIRKKKDAPMRFDVISIGPDGLRHIRDAFEIS
jgi:putative endonuclease